MGSTSPVVLLRIKHKTKLIKRLLFKNMKTAHSNRQNCCIKHLSVQIVCMNKDVKQMETTSSGGNLPNAFRDFMRIKADIPPPY